MYSPPLTIQHVSHSVPAYGPALEAPKSRWRIRWIEWFSGEGMSIRIRVLLWAIMINTILLSLLYIELFMLPNTNYVKNIAIQEASLGPKARHFVQNLKKTSLAPEAIEEVTRFPLTVQGSMIAFGGDNIQIFEYSDSKTAKREALLLAQKYASSSRSLDWKKGMHVYLDNNLVIFYMGNREEITNTVLSQNAHQIVSADLIQSDEYFTFVSKGGKYFK